MHTYLMLSAIVLGSRLCVCFAGNCVNFFTSVTVPLFTYSLRLHTLHGTFINSVVCFAVQLNSLSLSYTWYRTIQC